MSFAVRHIGPRETDLEHMLDVVGVASLDDLVDQAMPAAIAMNGPLDLPEALDEAAHLARMRELAALNNPGRSMIGMGWYGTVTPAVVRRNVLENPAWYTAYTPYQPEISQGRLEALLNFQTMVADLTALPTAGSSLLDEATAAAEAMALCRRQVKKGAVFLVDSQVLPQTLAVLRTRATPLDIEVVVAGDDLLESLRTHEVFGVLVQVPGLDGSLRPPEQLRAIADLAHDNGALVVAAADLLALTLVVPPGEWGADIAVGSSQRFGVPLFYGGPHAGYISVAAGLERSLPGRLVGVSVDAAGVQAYRLALQTREQHIRREKATSNICTAQVLLAVCASMYAVHHGPDGLTRIARTIHQNTRRLAGALVAAGHRLASDQFFDTLTVEVPDAASVVAAARAAQVHLRHADDTHVGISVGEDATEADLVAVAEAFGARLGDQVTGGLAGHRRTSPFCTHEVFTSHHSETRMMRYLRTLADRDFALDRGMIPLGSCTMKLNAAAELEPISYPGFGDLHPYVPAEDATGYAILIAELEQWLVQITGYDRVSLQPNAGSQGEFAGLVAIRGYHRSRGDNQRTVCLIPSSAHGTNAASAAMAGMRVVVVKATDDGSVDLDDLRAKIDKHAHELAAIMVTYPSTHGVFEDTITELCEAVHSAGGQVYVDGANMNALVGLARPGAFGADVSHLNLHKTFAIPHGGGGPGVGPVAVREHLAPFLPNHPVVEAAGPATSSGAISGAPWGSAGVLPISHGYIAMMGPHGLREATQIALLNANYVAARLREHYPVLYAGSGGLVAHECILDLRPLTKASGVTVDDVAKRLVDHGFHAPTMSFPVAGTLMVEPTESEDLAELDRFCDAMIAIRAEIDQVRAGEWPADDNPLRNAPHTLAVVTADEWSHPYSRRQAAYPSGQHRGPIAGHGHDKYWPPVARIDNVYGDRNLVCSCPPPEAYED
ncbi:aminomethyl-transferring glycine dehydrogenase [Aestuariimicrobium sp. T2.26MG-19.2B]|uniref:aminomethyl-transferring glycine dehydrogenase n=1 Tax=Aestuariimicrobium sp. T2.26MG-19.2B TaxID=3040679 RepID=UPI00253F7622|nr:aminomethyl-transferring glycine dehydrogenase [Aestuariimicrobium sp. T2.26MG-19.2B]